MKRNHWKLSFRILFAVSILGISFLLYTVIDQSVILNYQKERYYDTDEDLSVITELYNKKCFSKESIQDQLKKHPYHDIWISNQIQFL